MPTTEVLKTAKWDSLHFMYKVNVATLAYKILQDCTPPSMSHSLNKKTSSIHHLRTMNTVIVPRFNTYFMKISVAFRASKSDKLHNLDSQAESPQTMPNNNDNDFLYY